MGGSLGSLNPTGNQAKRRAGKTSFRGRAHQLITQYQMASPENIHTSNIHTEHVVLKYFRMGVGKLENLEEIDNFLD